MYVGNGNTLTHHQELYYEGKDRNFVYFTSITIRIVSLIEQI